MGRQHAVFLFHGLSGTGTGQRRSRRPLPGIRGVWLETGGHRRSAGRETFEQSKLKWPELKQEKHARIFNWYKELIRLRSDEPLLNNGRMDCVDASFDEVARWFIVKRGNISVICNLSTHEQSISLERGRYQLLLTSEADNVLANGQITMAPETVIIIKEIIERDV